MTALINIVAIIIVILWFVLLAAAIWSAIRSVRQREWEMVTMMTVVTMSMLVVTLFVMVFLSQENIVLTKADWTCTASVREQSTTYVKSGPVMNPITSTYDACVEYRRK